jgi:cleavage and polyadenylation specificity factor subunit 1
MTANFLVDHKQIGFMLTDELSNITLFNFLPEMKESIGGERLIIRAALNIGSLVIFNLYTINQNCGKHMF